MAKAKPTPIDISQRHPLRKKNQKPIATKRLVNRHEGAAGPTRMESELAWLGLMTSPIRGS